LPAARTPRTDGIASAVVASAAVRNIVRRVTVVFCMFFPPLSKSDRLPAASHPLQSHV
jgi:hypothetical protein